MKKKSIKRKKLNLSFVELKDELDIITKDELMMILGGCYGGPTQSWDSVGGFVNNVNGMIGAGLFNYGGTGDYSYTYGVQDIGSGFQFGSGSNFGSSIPQGSFSFSLGSNFSLGLGSGTYTGSLYQPGGLEGSIGSYSVNIYLQGGDLEKPTIKIKDASGSSVEFGYDGSKETFSVGYKIPFN